MDPKQLLHPHAHRQLPNRTAQIFYCLVLVGLLIAGGLDVFRSTQRAQSGTHKSLDRHAISQDIHRDIDQLEADFMSLDTRQKADKNILFDVNDVKQDTDLVKLNIQLGEYRAARDKLSDMQEEYKAWKLTLTNLENARLAQAKNPAMTPSGSTVPSGFKLTVPILMYHKTPANFDVILTSLEQKGYRTITLTELSTALKTKQQLPGKPVVITFDDGFSDQLTAFSLLKKHSMKATFYIISGGEASKWCIGANRTNSSCGDGYMNWNDIKLLDSSGLIEIGGHTVDHLSLPAQTPAVQKFQIEQNKRDIESQLGHPIKQFAFPYGNLNAASMNLVREAGYETAVCTIDGSIQSIDILYSLHRVRDAMKLP
ncbi:MAG: polysaccharide deacetylase family protein [bacterium]